MKTPRHNGGAVHSRSMKAKTMTVAAVGTEQEAKYMSIAKKEKRAIEYLKAFEPKDEPYYLCYSGERIATVFAYWNLRG